MPKVVSTPDKLAAVERLIEDFREYRNMPDTLEHETYVALKAIAADIRATMDGAPSAAEAALEQRVLAAVRADTHHGRLVALANEVVARWPIIKQALAKFAEEVA